jgi:Ca-activated chloride channel family protein
MRMQTGVRPWRTMVVAVSAVGLLGSACGGGGGGDGGAGSTALRRGEPGGGRATSVVADASVADASVAGAPPTTAGYVSTTTAPGTAVRTAERGPDGRPLTVPVANPWTDPAIDAASTFGLDVDTGSYSLARKSLDAARFPAPDEVRTEEFVNAFEQGYRRPEGSGFSISVDGAPTPFVAGEGHRLVRVGLATRELAATERRPARLTFVIDVSGSMADPGKLDLVKVALGRLTDQLRDSDTVAIVVYGDDARTVLEPTRGSETTTIRAAIDRLRPEGSTNAEAGIVTGYEVARSMFSADAINRLVLTSDGVANVGATSAEAIGRRVGDEAAEGIALVTAGFGLGDYDDALMEQLADRGDGFYAYVDDEAEAERLFVTELTSTLQLAALEARAQVVFDPATVARYRLVGFENRAIADERFRDDRVDAGEIGAGHTVTALYEVQLVAGDGLPEALGQVQLRWLDPDTRTPIEHARAIGRGDLAPAFDAADPHLQLDAAVAAFAERLRGSEHAADVTLAGVAEVATAAARRLDRPDATAFADLAARAAALRTGR